MTAPARPDMALPSLARVLPLLALLLATPALAQPSTADSSLVETVLDAATLEQSLAGFEMGASGLGAPTTVAVVRDSVRAALYADFRPDLLLEVAAFTATPAYQRAVLDMRADTAWQALVEHPRLSGTAPRADSALTARYLAATGMLDVMLDAQQRTFKALLDSVPPFRRALEASGAGSGQKPDSILTLVAQATAAAFFEGTRIGLAETADEDVEAVIAFYETPAGPYFRDTVGEGTLRALLPATVRMMREWCAAAPGSVATPPDTTHISVFEVVQEPPELIGGLDGLMRRVDYPEMARREGIEGRVIVQFIVDERGAVTDAACVRSPAEMLCEAALDAVRTSRFVPGRQDGRPVKVRYALPVVFKLTDEEIVLPVADEEPVLIGGSRGLHERVRYPATARRRGYQGAVAVLVTVGTDGVPREAACARTPHRQLCEPAMRAVLESRYEPARRGGAPVEVRHVEMVRFVLR